MIDLFRGKTLFHLQVSGGERYRGEKISCIQFFLIVDALCSVSTVWDWDELAKVVICVI
jgi:hypothetical protein